MFENAKSAGLEREIAIALVSATLSATIAGMWRSGSAKWADWTGEGQAFKDAATVMYLTLNNFQIEKHPIILTVPLDLLDPKNTSRFTNSQEKKS